MAKPLSQTAVDRARPRATRYEIPDGRQPGLYLVVQPSGTRSWALRTRIGGKPAEITLGNAEVISLDEAREQAHDALRQARQPTPQTAPRYAAPAPTSDTLLAAVEGYLADHGTTLRPRSLIEVKRHLLDHWAPFHARPLAELTLRQIAAQLLS